MRASNRLHPILLLLAITSGCDALGGGDGDLPPPDEGSRRVISESSGPASMSFHPTGYLRTLSGTFPVSGESQQAATVFVEGHADLFGIDQTGYTVTAVGVRTVLDMEVVELQTSYEGVPIAGGAIVVVVSAGAVRYVSSGLPPPMELDVTPTLTAPQARAAVDALHGATVQADEPELVIADVGALVGDASSGAELAWRVRVFAPVAEETFVSAVDGRILVRPSRRPTMRMRTVRDADGSADLEASLSTAAVLANEGGVVTSTTDGDAIYENLATVYDYYERRLDWESYDGECGELQAAVNVSLAVVGQNAFWSEETEGFFFTPGVTSLDITVHEFTHAVVDHVGVGAPYYAAQSGALDESLSDVFAAFATPGAGQWSVGEGSSLGTLRNLSDPSALNHPDYFADFARQAEGGCDPDGQCPDEHYCREGSCICLTEACDYGGVHSNSSIVNHIVYLATLGGRHATRGGANLEGVGVGKMEQILFTSMSLLHVNTGFERWREDVVLACQVLAAANASFPSSGGPIEWQDCGKVINAFEVGGIGPGDRDEDSYNDEVDNCPNVFNPSQEPTDDCIRDPWLRCSAFQYERAFEEFLAGADIGFERNAIDALIITSQCAFLNLDFHTSLRIALAAAERSSSGASATAFYIAEYAAERLGMESRAEGYRAEGTEASKSSGMCEGLSEDALEGCADFQRSGVRGSIDARFERDGR